MSEIDIRESTKQNVLVEDVKIPGGQDVFSLLRSVYPARWEEEEEEEESVRTAVIKIKKKKTIFVVGQIMQM